MKWIESHGLQERFPFETKLNLLLHYLDSQEPDYHQAQIVLKSANRQESMQLVHRLLKVITVYHTRSFLITLFLEKERPFDDSAFTLRQELMGIQLLEYVAPKFFDRTQLFPLVSAPHLILEQWVMNVKLDAVEKGIEVLKDHLDTASEHPKEDSLSWDQFHSIVETYAAKALETSGVQVATKERIASLPLQFVIPLEVPSKSDWESNSVVVSCPLCNALFSLFCRRHHCRRCGRVVCSACSRNRLNVENYSVPVRVCAFCFEHLTKSRPRVRRESVVAEDVSNCSEIGWFFTTDLNQIKTIREEFVFECAPSISLCQAILALHRDDKRASVCVFGLSYTLLKVAIDAISASESEIDCNLVLRMSSTLVKSAKVRFAKITNEEGMGACEYFLQWTDLLQLLLQEKCHKLLPPDAFPNMIKTAGLKKAKLSGGAVDPNQIFHCLDKERKYIKILRDKLVMSEKWNLALNVSTKGGFETHSVWAAWAMAALKAGDFATARENFSKVRLS